MKNKNTILRNERANYKTYRKMKGKVTDNIIKII